MEIDDASLVTSQQRSQETFCRKYKPLLGIFLAGGILFSIGSLISAFASSGYLPQYLVLGIVCLSIGLSAIGNGIMLMRMKYQTELLRPSSVGERNTTQTPTMMLSRTQTSTTTEDTTEATTQV